MRLMTVQVGVVLVQTSVVGVDVVVLVSLTWYPIMAGPLSEGATQFTTIEFPVAIDVVGCAGVPGVTNDIDVDAAENVPVP
jgi:hypothetical protein